MSPLPERLPTVWRERAAQLSDWGGSPEAARLWARAAVELEQALVTNGDEVLRLPEAARRCGLTAAHLADLIRRGKLPNAGRKAAPRIRAADLPPRTAKPEPVLPQPKQSVSRTNVTHMAKRILRRR